MKMDDTSKTSLGDQSSSDSSTASTPTRNATKAANLKKKSSSLPPETVEYLKNWMMSPEHIAHPYPTEQEKAQIMADTGIELKQLTNWFVNNRKRYWKPRVEARLREQAEASVGGTTTPSAVLTTALIKPTAHAMSADLAALNLHNALSQLQNEAVQAEATRKRSVEIKDTPRAKPTTVTLIPNVSSPRQVSDQSSVSSVCESTSSSSFRDQMLTSPSPIPAQSITTTMTSDQAYCSVQEEITRSVSSESLALQGQEESNSAPKTATTSTITTTATTSTTPEVPAATPPRKRTQTCMAHHQADVPNTPRHKYRRVSLDLWRSACQSARSGWDVELPSLEEATQLFGYAR